MWRKTFWKKKPFESQEPWEHDNRESFPTSPMKIPTSYPIIVGKEGIPFREPTKLEAKEFLTIYIDSPYITIQHCPLGKVSLQMIVKIKCEILSLKKIEAEPLKLANAIKRSGANTICLLDDPEEIQPLLRALTGVRNILPKIQLCPISRPGFKRFSKFMMWSHLSKLSLKLDGRDEINIRRAFRLVSALDQLKEFYFIGQMRFEDFYSLSVSEKRNDSFRCHRQPHKENILLPKHIAQVAKLDMTFNNSLSYCILKNIVALQERSNETDVIYSRSDSSFGFSLRACHIVIMRSRSIFKFRGKGAEFP